MAPGWKSISPLTAHSNGVGKKKGYRKISTLWHSLLIVFDGSTRLGKGVVVVVRYGHNWKIRKVLTRLVVLSKSLNGDQLAAELNDVI